MLSLGLVGLPNVGKSTLFNTLLGKAVAAAENFPFCTIEPNVGVVPVIDPRLTKIAAAARTATIVPAGVEVRDIAGLVRGASDGAGLGNQFLGHIRECAGILEVVRFFEDGGVTHVDGAPDPARDHETINLELCLADLGTVKKRREKTEKLARAGEKSAVAEVDFLSEIERGLDAGIPVRRQDLARFGADPREIWRAPGVVRELGLLTAKPLILVGNFSETGARPPAELGGEPVFPLSVKFENEVAALDPAEAAEMREMAGLPAGGLDALLRRGFEAIGLQTFFTAGEKEARAWTTRAGAGAPEAAGAIHSDFEKSFIRAEVVGWEDFVALGGWAGARDAGKCDLRGKDATVADGEVCLFRTGK